MKTAIEGGEPVEYEKIADEMFHMVSKLRFGQQTRPLSNATHGEHFALVYIYQRGCVQPGDLAQVMNASTAYVAKMLRGLEEREMIRRRPDDQDRRRTLITLTKAGESAAQKDMDFVRGHIIQMLETLGEEDAQHFLRILKKLIFAKEQSEN